MEEFALPPAAPAVPRGESAPPGDVQRRAPPGRDVYSVTRLNREARTLLEAGLPGLWIEGELSNFSRPGSGHWYFSLKDAGAQVRCAMFRGNNSRVRVAPRDGLQVLLRARVSLYEARGDYQLIVEHLEEAGVRYVDQLRDDDLPGAPGDRSHSWLGLMKFDYVTMVSNLGGDASTLEAINVDASADRADYPQ